VPAIARVALASGAIIARTRRVGGVLTVIVRIVVAVSALVIVNTTMLGTVLVIVDDSRMIVPTSRIDVHVENVVEVVYTPSC
jgi:hypothetical protein